MPVQDLDSFVLSSRLTTILNVFVDPTLISSKALADCSDALFSTIAAKPVLACSQSTYSQVVRVMSSLYVLGRNTSKGFHSSIQHYLFKFAEGCQSTMVEDQEATTAAFPNIRMAILLARDVSLSASTVDIPLSEVEQNALTAASTVTAVSSLQLSNSAKSRLTALQFPGNPTAETSSAAALTVQVESLADANTQYELQLDFTNIYPVSYSEIIPHTLPVLFCEEAAAAYSVSKRCPGGFNITATCPGGRGFLNMTCRGEQHVPLCTILTEAGFVESSQCSVSSYSSTRTICHCRNISFSGTARRLATSPESQTFGTSRGVSITEFEPLWIPAEISLQESFTVVIVLGIALGVFLLFFAFVYWSNRRFAKVALAVKVREIGGNDEEANGVKFNRRSIAAFFDSIFDIRSKGMSTIRQRLLSQHFWFSFVLPSTLKPVEKVSRRAIGMSRFFCIIASTSAAVGILFPDNGFCESIASEASCIDAQNLLGTKSICKWNSKFEYCQFSDSPIDGFVIMQLLVISVIATTIFNKFFELFFRYSVFMTKYALPPLRSQALHIDLVDAITEEDMDEFIQHSTERSLLLLACRLCKQTATIDAVLPNEEVLQVMEPVERELHHRRQNHASLLGAEDVRYAEIWKLYINQIDGFGACLVLSRCFE